MSPLLGYDRVAEALELLRPLDPLYPALGKAHHPLGEGDVQASLGVSGNRRRSSDDGLPSGDGGPVLGPVDAFHATKSLSSLERPLVVHLEASPSPWIGRRPSHAVGVGRRRTATGRSIPNPLPFLRSARIRSRRSR